MLEVVVALILPTIVVVAGAAVAVQDWLNRKRTGALKTELDRTAAQLKEELTTWVADLADGLTKELAATKGVAQQAADRAQETFHEAN